MSSLACEFVLQEENVLLASDWQSHLLVLHSWLFLRGNTEPIEFGLSWKSAPFAYSLFIRQSPMLSEEQVSCNIFCPSQLLSVRFIFSFFPIALVLLPFKPDDTRYLDRRPARMLPVKLIVLLFIEGDIVFRLLDLLCLFDNQLRRGRVDRLAVILLI